jgi:hypothetical protein
MTEEVVLAGAIVRRMETDDRRVSAKRVRQRQYGVERDTAANGERDFSSGRRDGR